MEDENGFSRTNELFHSTILLNTRGLKYRIVARLKISKVENFRA